MRKLLIVDDEPLVQVGIKSMISWENYGVSICGTANNGVQALELIEAYSPEIIITDIKMPIMNGLELAQACREKYGPLPVIIMLTSYEEFKLVKEALKYQVLDYLIKLELTAENLGTTIEKALKRISEIQETIQPAPHPGRPMLQSFHDKFFLRLFHNLFESENQFLLQCKDLNLEFAAPFYAAAHCQIHSNANHTNAREQMDLCASTLQMVRELTVKYIKCYVTSLDINHFAILFCLDEGSEREIHRITGILNQVYQMTYKYFNVTITAGIGRPSTSPLFISESYQDARLARNSVNEKHPIVVYSSLGQEQAAKNAFNISIFKSSITKAFEEFDVEVLEDTIDEIIALFKAYPNRYLQAIDGACNILYLAISLLPDGEKAISGIFPDYPDGYLSIYRQTNTDQLIQWMNVFRNGLCQLLLANTKTYKHNIMANVEKYIKNHIEERLTLAEVAAVFSVSPNYLSVLFKKYNSLGFSEYITQQKIHRAKQLMMNPNLKIYEIADMLGYDNAFYFSKVFKKVEGCSPRDYLQGGVKDVL